MRVATGPSILTLVAGAILGACVGAGCSSSDSSDALLDPNSPIVPLVERDSPAAQLANDVHQDSNVRRIMPKEALALTFAGDIMAHDENYTRRPYDAIYTDVMWTLLADDLTFGNLEFPIDDSKPLSTFPNFNIHTDYIEAAIKGGFQVFSNANNHACDQGADSVIATREAMKRLSGTQLIHYSGIRDTEGTAFEPIVIQQKGWKIGFLAVTEFLNEGEGAGQVQRVRWRTAPDQRASFIEQVRKVAPQYDLFVLSCHCGREYETAPGAEEKAFYYDLAKAGADIVWGHHPHVLQPWEKVSVDGATRVIMYSVGNFVSGQPTDIKPTDPDYKKAGTAISALFQVKVTQGFGANVEFAVSPVLTGNYVKDAASPVVVRFLEPLAEDPTVPKAWHDYYVRELAEAKALLTEQPVVELK